MKYYPLILAIAVVLILVSGCRERTYEDVVRNLPEVPQPSCFDDCPGESRDCYNRTFLELCGHFDEDSCLDLNTAPCMVGAYCREGVCIFKTWEQQQEEPENQTIEEEPPAATIQDSENIDKYLQQSQPSGRITSYIPPLLPSQQITGYISPGDYARIEGIHPFEGNPDAILKVLFVKIGNPPYFNEIVDRVIEDQLGDIPPFKGKPIAYYKTSISESGLDCKASVGGGLGGSGFSCNNYEVYKRVLEDVTIDDIRGIIVIGITESEYGGSGGDIIYIGVNPANTLQVSLDLSKNVAIHEIGHNFGLGDLYAGILYFDGSPSQFYGTEASRQFLNIDGPGCSKWCDSYKPVSQYTESVSAPCLNFNNRDDCVAFGRDHKKFCEYKGNAPICCVWSDTPFEYFKSKCVPAWGTEDIGIGCYEDSGCYFGAMYGNYAWRPVLGDKEMMYSAADNFSSVSRRELETVFECCLSTSDSSSRCEDFREDYSDFMNTYNFKKRIGSCGHSVN